MPIKISIEVSARHAHLSKEDVKILFGHDQELTPAKDLSQPGQFTAKQRIDLIGSKAEIKNVAIVGPERSNTQVEISQTDAYQLGLKNIPVLASGDLAKSVGGLIIRGLVGEIGLEKGIIIPARHLHISPEQAQEFNLKDGDLISIKTSGQRSIVFNNVLVRPHIRVDELAFHLNTDEANAAGVKTGDWAVIARTSTSASAVGGRSNLVIAKFMRLPRSLRSLAMTLENSRRFSVRLVRPADAKRVWQIRNHPVVKTNSNDPNKFSFEEHDSWFENKYLTNQNNHCYILAGGQDLVIGYCRFDLDEKQDKYLSSIAIDPDYHGQGLGHKLLSESVSRLNTVKEVLAEILKDNIASIKIFQKVGFEVYNEDEKKYYLKYAKH